VAQIPITGIASNFRVPGAYAEILFGQGPSSAGAPSRDIVIAMPMLSTGTWTAGTLYGPIRSSDIASSGAGPGSPLHRAFRVIAKANRDADVYALPVAETTGGVPVKANLDVTYATNPTGSGVTTVWVSGERNDYAFDSNDTPTTIAAGIADVISGKTHLAVTAANAAGVLTITAKLNGISQGDGTTGAIRVRGEIDTGIATTIVVEDVALGLGTSVTGAEGTTTEAANLATALTTIDARRLYYIVTSAWDATSLANLVTHISTKSEPKRGHRSIGIAAFTGTLAAGQTIATAQNHERLNIAWQKGSEHDPAELAANLVAVRQKHESVDSAYNFAGYRAADWTISAAFSEANWPNADDQNDAINDGLTVIGSDAGGSYIVMSVNTRSKTGSPAVDDFRATETHRVSVGDDFVDTLLVRHTLNFTGRKLRADARLTNGKIDPNQRLGPGVITPSKYKPTISKLARDFESSERIANAQTVIDSTQVLIDPANGSRIEVGLDFEAINHFHQGTFRVSETSSG